MTDPIRKQAREVIGQALSESGNVLPTLAGLPLEEKIAAALHDAGLLREEAQCMS